MTAAVVLQARMTSSRLQGADASYALRVDPGVPGLVDGDIEHMAAMLTLLFQARER